MAGFGLASPLDSPGHLLGLAVQSFQFRHGEAEFCEQWLELFVEGEEFDPGIEGAVPGDVLDFGDRPLVVRGDLSGVVRAACLGPVLGE